MRMGFGYSGGELAEWSHRVGVPIAKLTVRSFPLQDKPTTNIIVLATGQFHELPDYKRYKFRFQEEFWQVMDGDINGSFHCEYAVTDGRVSPKVSWSCFKIKQVQAADQYDWIQPTVHVDWDPATGRQVVYVFGLPPTVYRILLKKIPSPDDRQRNPFCWHAAFARLVLELYDGAFWMLRDLVRSHEKARSDERHKPKDFPLLHDIARHLFHYNETIEVAEHTLRALTEEQMHWRREDSESVQLNLDTWIKTLQDIKREEKRAHSLKTRSKSLNDRHQNEINLAFNLVSQSFGRDARTDSNMMKTVAVVSMVYLPGTFVSGLFGTNFFSFQADPPNTWITSDKFWIYWLVTIPLTLLTVLVWAVWHWREVYPRWYKRAIHGKPKPSDDEDVAKESHGANNQFREKTESFLSMQRVATALGLRPVQRQETV
ncbi:hypothetical protein BJX68DRAFT_226448 [Aspergillus pseudodeflectus]|uniref:Uncharacterized protein n=1 Tax=Aspergillus pseudodeflectus TaxID=176178 RepID=A0ABR4L4W6_9EURO